ncbi:STE20-related kinase adapter protein alpha isoform X5 [Macrotis lagotis]|uniref:STE20-related kinase adapter protein alpha isoform X5 n=1 Tax=Macrotis lagotis TaxID=92651 RepID=UPI003D69BFFB
MRVFLTAYGTKENKNRKSCSTRPDGIHREGPSWRQQHFEDIERLILKIYEKGKGTKFFNSLLYYLKKTNESSSESIASSSKQDTMSSFLPEGRCYELLTIIGKGFEELMTVNLARYKPTGEHVTIRRINLEACTNEMVTYLQGELHVSKLFNHPNIVPYRATFIADNELWVVTSFMAYGSAKDLICTQFMDGMNELAIAYILQGVLKALDYIHHMGYVHRSVKASHILISADGKVYLSGLRSSLSMINHGQRQRVVHDFPKYSIKVLPWLSPEVLQQNLQGYDAKSDIYSVGITACELANGHVPFKDMPATQAFHRCFWKS